MLHHASLKPHCTWVMLHHASLTPHCTWVMLHHASLKPHFTGILLHHASLKPHFTGILLHHASLKHEGLGKWLTCLHLLECCSCSWAVSCCHCAITCEYDSHWQDPEKKKNARLAWDDSLQRLHRALQKACKRGKEQGMSPDITDTFLMSGKATGTET